MTPVSRNAPPVGSPVKPGAALRTFNSNPVKGALRMLQNGIGALVGSGSAEETQQARQALQTQRGQVAAQYIQVAPPDIAAIARAWRNLDVHTPIDFPNRMALLLRTTALAEAVYQGTMEPTQAQATIEALRQHFGRGRLTVQGSQDPGGDLATACQVVEQAVSVVVGAAKAREAQLLESLPACVKEFRTLKPHAEHHLGLLIDLGAKYCDAAAGKSPTVKARIDEWAGQGGELLGRYRKTMHKAVMRDAQGLTTPQSMATLRAQLAVLEREREAWARSAPFSLAALRQMPSAPVPPAVPLSHVLHGADVKTLVERECDVISQTIGSTPYLRGVAPALEQDVGGRLAQYGELESIAKAAHEDARLANGYLATGCYARAQLVANRLRMEGINHAKMFVNPVPGIFVGSECLYPKGGREGEVPEGQEVYWGYHVAATAFARDPTSGQVNLYILDPGFSDKPLRVAEWLENFVVKNNDLVSLELREPAKYEPNLAAGLASFSQGTMLAWEKVAELNDILAGRQPRPEPVP